MAASPTFKISDAVRDVLARSTITATSVKLPDEQLERKLYEAVNKALEGAGGKWNRSKKVHVFERDPRELLGLAVETGKATNVRTALQAFYTPDALAQRVVAAANIAMVWRSGQAIRVLEPSIGEGALAVEAASKWGEKHKLEIIGYDVDEVALGKARAAMKKANVVLSLRDFLTVEPGGLEAASAGGCIKPVDVVLMNPPFTRGADIAHVTHAWQFVAPGGVLVAIMSPHFQHASTKAAIAFRAHLEMMGERAETEDIPAGTFEHTGVASVLVLMRKPAG